MALALFRFKKVLQKFNVIPHFVSLGLIQWTKCFIFERTPPLLKTAIFQAYFLMERKIVYCANPKSKVKILLIDNL